MITFTHIFIIIRPITENLLITVRLSLKVLQGQFTQSDARVVDIDVRKLSQLLSLKLDMYKSLQFLLYLPYRGQLSLPSLRGR